MSLEVSRFILPAALLALGSGRQYSLLGAKLRRKSHEQASTNQESD